MHSLRSFWGRAIHFWIFVLIRLPKMAEIQDGGQNSRQNSVLGLTLALNHLLLGVYSSIP